MNAGRVIGTCLLAGAALAAISCTVMRARHGWTARKGPVVPHDNFPADCSLCHQTGGWNDLQNDFVFDHLAETGSPLIGAHVDVQCLQCHNDRGPVAEFADRGCVGCHDDPHQGDLGEFCDGCHVETTWQPEGITMQHDATRFPLVGAHVAVACHACHAGAESGSFQGADPACESCHIDDASRSTGLDHLAQNLTADCESCHVPSTWENARFPHTSSFPLTAAHDQSCTDCHSGTSFAGLSTTCFSCHSSAFSATTDPDHVASGFTTTCEDCHTPTTWGSSIFQHSAGLPLQGAHDTSCSACHSGGSTASLSTECASCHLTDYQGTTNPDHAAGGYSTACESCHGTSGWSPASFSHPASFPLTGGHATAQCNDCHTAGVFAGVDTACSSCHLDDYQATTNPNHAASSFPTTCDSCHTTSGWSGAVFAHTSTFPLSGGHASPACTDCHVGGVYTGLSPACVTCHLSDYQGTTNPNHATAGFPTTCDTCHTINGWAGATFSHTPAFPLSGGHASPTCSDCHTGGVYAGLPSDCVSCHLSDYQGTTNPNHSLAAFATTCANCHTIAAWMPSTYTHIPSFPLSGGHAVPTCNDCHGGGTFAGLPSDCVSCHLSDYQGTTNPNHAASGFPTTCDTCHSISGWAGAVFNHTFPQGHGNANDCSDCHPSLATSPVFSCISGGCHPQGDTDNDHSGVGGYVYESTACLACHPNGNN